MFPVEGVMQMRTSTSTDEQIINNYLKKRWSPTSISIRKLTLFTSKLYENSMTIIYFNES